jgi:hypothetical protein
VTARRWLYRSARLLGDVNAVKRGRYTRRIVRKAQYRAIFRLLGRFLR